MRRTLDGQRRVQGLLHGPRAWRIGFAGMVRSRLIRTMAMIQSQGGFDLGNPDGVAQWGRRRSRSTSCRISSGKAPTRFFKEPAAILRVQ